MTEALRAIGLMSGTSMDGVDVALIETDGEAIVRRRADMFFEYTARQRTIVEAALAEAAALDDRTARPPALAEAETEITDAHVAAVRRFLENRDLGEREIDVVGFHGQTVLHRPERRLTIQIGDGMKLARTLGIRTVYDLRAADVRVGGQGAPLAPVYHRALLQSGCLPATLPAALVNLGGVSNVTWIGREGELMAFDTGPGNALVDDWVHRHTGARSDLHGAYAESARDGFDGSLLDEMLKAPYLDEPPPKSLDRNHFSTEPAEGLSLREGAALLTEFTAACLERGAEWFPERPREWVVCGGGRNNPEMMHQIERRLRNRGARVRTAENCGLNGDSVEAEAFAYLAVRSLRGLPLSFPGTTGCPKPLTGGVLCPI